VYSTGNFDYCEGNERVNSISGNLYVEKVFMPRFKMNIDGDAYLKGGVNPNTNLPNISCITGVNGLVTINGNSTIGGNYFYYDNSGGSSVGFHVAGNLVMDAGNITVKTYSTTTNNDDSLAVYGNVCVKNAFIGSPVNANVKTIPFFGNAAGNEIRMPGTWSSSSSGGIKTFTNGSYKIRSKGTLSPLASGDCSARLSTWGADPMDGSKSDKNWKEKIDDGDGKRGCENVPIQFDKDIYDSVLSSTQNWVHRQDKPGSCAKYNNSTLKLADPNIWVDLGEELQDCYTKASAAGELKDGWLVVYIKDKTQFSGAKALESGKYIIVLDITPNRMSNVTVMLPQTRNNSQIMLYLPNGFMGNNCRLMLEYSTNCSGVCDEYNYFVFSDDDITEFNTNTSNKLHGNIFMNNCSTMNTLTTGGTSTFNSRSNTEFVEALMDKGILCKYGSGDCGFANDKGGIGVGGGGSVSEYISDKIYTPTASKLSVKLVSKEISKEILRTSPKQLDPSIVVMPRVVRLALNSTVSTMTDLQKHYGYIYLNNANKNTSIPPPTCKDNAGADISFSKAGTYTCTFNGTGTTSISNFYVIVGTTSLGGYNPSGGSLTCTGMASAGIAGNSITQPIVKCDGTTLTSGLTWTNQPTWNNPAQGTYNVSVSASCGGSAKSAGCGTLTVVPAGNLECIGLPQTATPSSLTKPTVKCDGTTVSNPTFNTTPTLSWTSPAVGGSYTVTVQTNCGGSTKTIGCGSVTISSTGASVGCSISGSYTVGAGKSCVGVPIPEITNCASPTDIEFRVESTSGSILNQWTGVGTTHSFCSARYGNRGKIFLTKVKCNGTQAVSSGTEKECGSITVHRPTCNNMPATVASGVTFTPAVACGDGVSTVINSSSFGTTTTYCSWNGSGTGGYFTRASDGDCVLNLNNLSCNGQALYNLGSHCYVGSVPHADPLPNSNVTVTTGGETCDYQPSWCEGLYTSATAVPTTVPTGQVAGGRCAFLKTITGVFNISNAKVNGVTCGYHDGTYNICSGITDKKDGGYYLYIPDMAAITSLTATGGGSPTCTSAGGTPPSGPTILGCCYWGVHTVNGKKQSDCYTYTSDIATPCPALISNTACSPTDDTCPAAIGCCDWGKKNNGDDNCWTLEPKNTSACPKLLTPGQACNPNNGTCPAEVSTPSSSSGPNLGGYNPWCNIAYGCYSKDTPVPPPTYGCSSGSSGGTSPKFQYTGAEDGNISSTYPSGWNTSTPGNHTFTNTTNETLRRNVYMYQIICGGTTINLLGTPSTSKDNKVHCSGYIDISPNCPVGGPSSSSDSGGGGGSSSDSGGGSSSNSGGGGTTCEYQASWCNNMYSGGNDVSTTVPTTSNSQPSERCVFLTNITGEFNINNAKINGVDCAWMNIPSNIPGGCTGYSGGTKDGGYYVYIPASAYVANLTATGGTAPNCTGGGPPSGGSTNVLGTSYNTVGFTGNVTLTCDVQTGFSCYADPPEALNIGCGNIQASNSTSGNPTYIGQCGGQGAGGSVTCSIPTGKVIYCKKS